jgi:hypothetical protein
MYTGGRGFLRVEAGGTDDGVNGSFHSLLVQDTIWCDALDSRRHNVDIFLDDGFEISWRSPESFAAHGPLGLQKFEQPRLRRQLLAKRSFELRRVIFVRLAVREDTKITAMQDLFDLFAE